MNQLEQITQKLIELDEDTLKAQLAIQQEELANNVASRSGSSLDSLEAALMAKPRGGFDQKIIKAGEQLFQKYSVQAYHLMCSDLFADQELKQKIQVAYKENSDKAAALLAPFLSSHFELTSSVAVLIAVLIIKSISSVIGKVASDASDSICELWKTKVDDSTNKPT